jgi:TPR repeat protein
MPYLHRPTIFPDYKLKEKDVILQYEAVIGVEESQFKFALSLKKNNTIDKDDRMFFYWIKKSADKGFFSSMVELYNCYNHGVGTPKNTQEAKNIMLKISRSIPELNFD